MMDVKKIGKFIAMNRKQKGMTQEQLGDKLGVTNKTVSRWENGNYMPDLSLLEPLSKLLDISINELLAGEKIEQVDDFCEKNLSRTIIYTAKKVNDEKRKISVFLMIAGVLMIASAFLLFSAESSWTSVYSLIGLGLFVYGVFRELQEKMRIKKLLISLGVFVFLFFSLLLIDEIRVCFYHKVPVYRYTTETLDDIIVYHRLWNNVYRVNANGPDEYFIIDSKKQYTLKTIPVSPFNREKCGIEKIKKYEHVYLGSNGDMGMLIEALPLSQYQYVFEIDTENNGLIIHYHWTDWYANENLYIQKSLLYNSVAIFALIDQVNYLQFHFSGSSYQVTREKIVSNYPDYEKIIENGKVNEVSFNRYVENQMNKEAFVKEIYEQIFDLN